MLQMLLPVTMLEWLPSLTIWESVLYGTFTPPVLLLLYLTWESITGDPDTVPTLYHDPGSALMAFVKHRCPRLGEPFIPPLWVRNAHLQTVIGSVLSVPDVTFDREYVALNDGGQVALDWVRCDKAPEAPVLVIMPGLAGDSCGMAPLCELAIERGYRPVVFNKRGHGGSQITTPKLQGFGDAADLRTAMLNIVQRYPEAKLVAAGISAGSGLLASYVGEYGKDSRLQAAVGISPGYDLKYLFRNCVKQPYNFIMTRNLKAIVKKHEAILSSAIDVDKALGSRNLAELEENVYCRLYGCKSMEEYWTTNNPIRNTSNGATPFLCISSLDDPVCREDCIVYDLFRRSHIFALVTVPRGGHCGFLEGPNLERWSDKVTLDYLGAVIEYRAEHSEL